MPFSPKFCKETLIFFSPIFLFDKRKLHPMRLPFLIVRLLASIPAAVVCSQHPPQVRLISSSCCRFCPFPSDLLKSPPSSAHSIRHQFDRSPQTATVFALFQSDLLKSPPSARCVHWFVRHQLHPSSFLLVATTTITRFLAHYLFLYCLFCITVQFVYSRLVCHLGMAMVATTLSNLPFVLFHGNSHKNEFRFMGM